MSAIKFSLKLKGNSRNFFKFNLSLILLIISNIIVISLALKQNWNFATIIMVYFSQSVIIGFFNFIKILRLKKFSTKNFHMNGLPVDPTSKTKISVAFFFLFHYGFFHFLYLFSLISKYFREAFFSNTKFVLFSIFFFFINHLLSFLINQKIDSEKIPNIGKIMSFPYARIIPMHFFLLIGVNLSNNSQSLLFFLILKTIADLVMHQIEHS
jgi:hypothetical protein